MKPILLAISILTISHIAFAQNDTINRTDSQNRKQGYWSKAYPNGKKTYEGYFINDKPVGEFKRFREDGSLKAIITYDETSTYSKAEFFTTDGKKIAEGYYSGKDKDSLWQYYNSNSALSYEERYNKGIKNGRFKQYFDNGKPSETIPYINGQIQGAMVQFHQNGHNKSIINFDKGTQHGSIKLFYPNGNIRIDGNYLNGLKDGEWKFYSEDGQLIETQKFIKGFPENYNQLVEKESKELEELLRNAGRIQEPTVESFLETMGNRPF